MINFVYNVFYYTYLIIRYRGDMIALGGAFNALFTNRKMITYHAYEVYRLAKINIVDNYLM